MDGEETVDVIVMVGRQNDVSNCHSDILLTFTLCEMTFEISKELRTEMKLYGNVDDSLSNHKDVLAGG